MFTRGQIIFAISFVVVFVGFMIYSYIKDAQNHKKYYQKAGLKTLLWSLLVIAVFLLLRFYEAVRTFLFA